MYLKNNCTCYNQGIRNTHRHYGIILHTHFSVPCFFFWGGSQNCDYEHCCLHIHTCWLHKKYIRKYLVFTNSIARTYFNQSQCNFRVLNPCRRLSPLLDPASDKHRILYTCICIYIYSHMFLSECKCSFKFYRDSLTLILTLLCTYCFKILGWFSVPKFRHLTWTLSVTHWFLGRSYCRLWV